MSEAATWRNSYLTAAQELRNGPPKKGIDRSALIEMLYQTPIERFPGGHGRWPQRPRRRRQGPQINLVLTDQKTSYVLWIENAVLHFKKAPPEASANATLTLTKPIFIKMMAGTAGREGHPAQRRPQGGRQQDRPGALLQLIDKAPGTFQIVTK